MPAEELEPAGVQTQPSGEREPSRWCWVLLAASLVLGAYWRVVEVPRALLFGDELHSLRLVPQGYAAILTSYQGTGAGMALPLLQRLLADLMGFNHWSIRLPALLGGLGLLLGTFPLALRLVGHSAAAGATALIATSSSLIFYAHFGRAYALATFVAFAFAVLCQRTAARVPLTWGRSALMGLLLGLLPWLHLTTLGFALPVMAGLALALGTVRERRRELLPLGAALLGGGMLACLLHLPAWDALVVFTAAKTEEEYFGGFGALDVAGVLLGSGTGAWIVLVLGLVASLAYLRRERTRGLPLVLGCVGPSVALALTRPFGDAYAYARYALPALPCVFLLIARFFEDPGWGRTTRPPLALLGCAFTGALLFSLAPRPWLGTKEGPHANTYLRLYALPAFDRPFGRTPKFYLGFGEDVKPGRILEAPMLTTRTRHLYRNTYLQHGQPTSLAVFPWELKELPDGPYVSLDDPDWRDKAKADYLVLHLQIAKEAKRYWNFVYGEEAGEPRDSTEAALMERHSQGASRRLRPPDAEIVQRLRQELGKPFFRDGFVQVWKLTGGETPDPRDQ